MGSNKMITLGEPISLNLELMGEFGDQLHEPQRAFGFPFRTVKPSDMANAAAILGLSDCFGFVFCG